jgi:hypothetical protein
MPRRAYTYPAEHGWVTLNVVETVGAVVLAVGLIAVVLASIGGWWRGRRADLRPVAGSVDGLEGDAWATAGESVLPVLTVLALAIAFVGMIAYLPWVAAIAAGVAAIFAVVWLSRRPDRRSEPAVATASLLAAALGVGVALAFVASYVYLSLAAARWPPLLKFSYPPGLILPTIAAVLAVAAAVLAIVLEDRVGAIAVAVLAIVGAVLEAFWLSGLPFEPSQDAYAAITSVLGWSIAIALGIEGLVALVAVFRPAPIPDDEAGTPRRGPWTVRLGGVAIVAVAAGVVVVAAWATQAIGGVVAG